MELFLWQWSTGVQVASALMIAVFFLALSRTADAWALRWWVRAWVANLGALVVTVAFWFLQPVVVLHPVLRGTYVASKTAFVALVIQGAWALRQPGTQLVRGRIAVAGIAAWSLLGAVALTTIPLIGVAEHALIAVAFGACGLALTRGADRGAARGLSWLATGLLIRSLLAVAESTAYGLRVLHPARGTGLGDGLGIFLATHSSLATAAEWLLALGCVLALSDRAHAELRRLADRDALTGLASRRVLPQLLRDGAVTGATLLFFDLDDFKGINDRHGHHAGDAYLTRFGGALAEVFAGTPGVVRYAGDEFVVVAPRLDARSAEAHVDRLHERVAADGGAPGIGFSVGVAELPAGGDGEAAIRAADEAMYRMKATRSTRRDAA